LRLKPFTATNANQVGSLRIANIRVSALEVGYYKFNGSGPEKMNAATLPLPESMAAKKPSDVVDRVANTEFEFLLACCSEEFQSARGQRLKQLAGNNFDWDKFLKLAEHHRVVPRVHAALNTYPDRIPSKIRDALRFRVLTNARQALLLTAELLRILSHLKSRGIEALAYKGPVLSHLLYADLTARQFGDLDLLIRKSDVSRAKVALLGLGYKSSLDLDSSQENAYLASGYEYTFDSDQGRNLVELKWQILPRFYSVNFDMNAIFERAIDVELNGSSVRTFRSEDLLLVLCVHAAKHAWAQLSLLNDIANIMGTQSLDWEGLRKQASDLGIERIVAVNVMLSHELFGTPIPITIPINRKTHRLTQQIASMLTKGEEYKTESFSYFALMMRLRERWGDRARFLWRLAVTPTVGEWSSVWLPDRLFPFYSVVRVFRLLGRFVFAR
jgi:putative nucleotidyltransferase-like protein